LKTLPDIISTVHLDCIGETTKSRWTGTFTVKCVLSHSERFAKTRMFAALMPAKIDLAEEGDKLSAEVLAQLSVRVASGPAWWDATGAGQLMTDLDPLVELLRLCQQAAEEWSKKLDETAAFEENKAIKDPK